MPQSVTLFYSFRSPYSWLGFHRARRVLPALDVDLRCIGVFPPPGMVTASTSTPRRLAYTLEDAARVAAAYGLAVRWPQEVDTEWVRPHACAYWAADARRWLRVELLPWATTATESPLKCRSSTCLYTPGKRYWKPGGKPWVPGPDVYPTVSRL